MFKDIHLFIKRTYQCQHTGNISKRNEMPLNIILEVKIFDVWGIHLKGPFLSYMGNQYTLISIDYMSKWIDDITSLTNMK